MALSASEALPLIAQYESGNQNVPNASGPGGTPASTASGYYQIINGTWQQFAPQAGVSLSQYPTAMSAPQAVQTSVATAIYNQQGIGPWSSDAPLVAAYTAAGGTGTTAGSGAGSVSGTTSTAAAPASTGGLSGLYNSATELLARGGLIFIGGGIVFIALVALLFQSKTVAVATRSVGTVA